MDIEEQKDDNKYPQIKPVKAKPHIRIPIVSVGFFPLQTLLNFNLCNGSNALLEPNSIVYGQKVLQIWDGLDKASKLKKVEKKLRST
jgi:hypothetical protein